MKLLSAVSAGVLVFLLQGGAGAASYTTATEDMKVSVELDFLAPQCYYHFDGTTLSWEVPKDDATHYMRLVVRDAGGQGTIAGCKVVAVLTAPKGKAVGTSVTLHETWDRELPHYGDNIQLPEDVTSGNVAIKLEPPEGRRMGRDVGNFLTKPVVVSFPDVDFRPAEVGQKPSEVTTEPLKVDWPDGRRPYVEPTPYPGSQAGEQ